MMNGIRMTPILAHGLPPAGFFILLCILLVGVVTCALVLGVIAKLLGRYYGPKARMGMGLLIEIVLGGCLVSWFGMWIWGFVTDPKTVVGGGISEDLWTAALIIAPLILIPFGKWLWRWLKENPNDGVFR
jgi:hypothetical protein